MTDERSKLVIAALCVTFAGVLSVTGHDGWKLFLVAALLLASMV